MNILMVHPHDIYSKLEPWTVRVVYIAREFVKKGHNVKLVYFPLQWTNAGPVELERGLTAIPFCRRLGPHILIGNIRRLYNLAKWTDVIHFQKCFYHAAIPAIIAGLLSAKPVHYDWDDWEFKIFEASTEPGLLRDIVWIFIGFLEKIIPRAVDTVSVASYRLRSECEKLGLEEGRIFEAHVGADITRFGPGVSGERVRREYGIEGPLVLYLGQLHGGQYVELFIEMASVLINEHRPDLSFMIVGDGYRSEELKKLTRRLDLDGRVIFTGAVDHTAVPGYIAAADICVACFQKNDVTVCKSPLKIVEYLASGKPIVASNVGEVPRMLGGAGILAAPGDPRSLADGVARLLADNGLRRELGLCARRRAEEEYNWKVTAGNLLKAYQKAR